MKTSLLIAIIGMMVVATLAFPQNPKTAKGMFCNMCKNMLTQALGTLEDADTEKQVEEQMETYCNNLLSEWEQSICKMAVKEGVTYIWQVLQQGGSNDQQADMICSCIGMCTDGCSIA